MKKNFFNAVNPGAAIGDGTAEQLTSWLERFVNVLFPENGIDYWSEQKFLGPDSLKSNDLVPTAACSTTGVNHVACYARPRGSEGRFIEVGLFMHTQRMQYFTFAKSFGSDEECWQIARAVAAALDSIIFSHEIPAIVEMSDRIPRDHKWLRETNLTQPVRVILSPTKLYIATSAGVVLENRDFQSEGANGKFHVQAIWEDWQLVLKNTKTESVVVRENQLMVDDLPGYIISDRGVPDCSGLYVLPPGGNPNDDRDYLGYFHMQDTAIKAARLHRDGRQTELAALLGSLSSWTNHQALSAA